MTTDNIYMKIASFDIGKKNFCFYIEEFNLTSLKNIKNIPKESRYNPNGTPTNKMKEILDQICLNGKTVLHKNTDLTYNCEKGKYLDPETFHNMNDLLDEHAKYFDDCDHIVIEQQMNFGKRKNPMAMKLGQHCYSYFTFKYGRFKNITEFPSYHKTQVLGSEKIRGKQYKNGNYKWKSIDQRARKKWSVEKAIEILETRGEIDVMDNLKTKAKKDDLADTLTQLQAFKYLNFIEKCI